MIPILPFNETGKSTLLKVIAGVYEPIAGRPFGEQTASARSVAIERPHSARAVQTLSLTGKLAH